MKEILKHCEDLQPAFIIAGVIITIISLVVAVFSCVADHRRRRRQATLDLCNQYLKEVEKGREIISDAFPNSVVDPNDDKYNNGELPKAITHFLNSYENTSVGVNFNVMDLKMFMRIEGRFLIDWYRKLKLVIDKKRVEVCRPTRYGDIEILVSKMVEIYNIRHVKYRIKCIFKKYWIKRFFSYKFNHAIAKQYIEEETNRFLLTKKKDVDEIFSLYVMRENQFRDQNDKQWNEYTAEHRFPKEYFSRQIKKKRYYALRQLDAITAGCVLLPTDEEMWGKTQNSVFIKNFVSGINVRDITCKGEGSIFLTKLFKHCKEKGYETIRLDCRDDKERLKAYYLKHGFIEVGKKPYDKIVNACLMEKKL